MKILSAVICLTIFSAIFSAGSVLCASAPINGYGGARFGDSPEAIRQAFPGIEQSSICENIWSCELDNAPHLVFPRADFLFRDGKLEVICISGTLTDSEISKALIAKYGRPDTSSNTWDPNADLTFTAIWNDARGNQLEFQYHFDQTTSLRYVSVTRAKILREEKNRLSKLQAGIVAGP